MCVESKESGLSFSVLSVWSRPADAETTTPGPEVFRRERVAQRREVGPLGLEEDHTFHKTRKMALPGDRALLAQSEEHYAELRAWFPTIAETFEPSTFGEQLTVSGVDSSRLRVGDVFISAQSSLTLQVSGPRLACIRVDQKHPLGLRSGSEGTVRQVGSANGRCGFFFRVLRAGSVADGDTFTCTKRGDWSVERVASTCYPTNPLRMTVNTVGGSDAELKELIEMDALMDHEWKDRLREVRHCKQLAAFVC